MSQTHVLYELRMLADDALAMLKNGKPDRAYDILADLVCQLDNEYERACDEECPDISDDIDESNYDPYCGCDIFEVDEVW